MLDIDKIIKDFPNPVQWYEGMLISTQHFQLSEAYTNRYVNLLAKISNGFNYGILSIKIDESALVSGDFIIDSLQCIMKDGTFINYSADKSNYKLEKNLHELFWTDSSKSKKLFLAVPNHEIGNNNFQDCVPRYKSVMRQNFYDENVGENPIDIPVKENVAYIFSEGEINDKFSYIPILEVKKSELGFEITDFEAPYCFINDSQKIKALCKNIAKVIKQRIGYILSKKKFLENNTYIESALRVLIQEVLPFDAMLNTEYVSTFEIYKYLLRITSAMISFTYTNVVPLLVSYDHDNPVIVFKSLESTILSSLNQIVEFSAAIPFIYDDNMFKLRLLPEWSNLSEILIGVRKATTDKKDDFLNWMNGMQIASESFVSEIRQKRVLGAQRVYVDEDHLGFENLSDDMLVIAVDPKSHYIRFGEDICVFNSSFETGPEDVMFFKKESLDNEK